VFVCRLGRLLGVILYFIHSFIFFIFSFSKDFTVKPGILFPPVYILASIIAVFCFFFSLLVGEIDVDRGTGAGGGGGGGGGGVSEGV